MNKVNGMYNAPAFRYFIKAVYAHASVPVTVYADDDAQALHKAKEVSQHALSRVIIRAVPVNA